MSGVQRLARQHRHDWAGPASRLCLLYNSLLLSATYFREGDGIDLSIWLSEVRIATLPSYARRIYTAGKYFKKNISMRHSLRPRFRSRKEGGGVCSGEHGMPLGASTETVTSFLEKHMTMSTEDAMLPRHFCENALDQF